LQARKGGLDRDTKQAISLDDVTVDVTEIVRLEVANAKSKGNSRRIS
jgi:hypothetical protein